MKHKKSKNYLWIMVATIKNWVSSGNIGITTSSVAAQYRELVWWSKELLLSASWTISMSAGNNGGLGFIAGLGDNIRQPSDVVFGTDGTENLSYYVAVPPAGWISSGPDTQIKALIVCDVTSSSTLPREIDFYFATTNFTFHATSGSNRPRAQSPAAQVLTGVNFSINPNAATPNAMRLNLWRTVDGDALFTTVLTGGTAQTDSAFWFVTPTGSGNGEGTYRCGFYRAAASNCFSIANLANASNWLAFADDNTSLGALGAFSLSTNMSNWTSGMSVASAIPDTPLELINNASAIGNGKYLGRIADVRGAAAGAVWGTLVDGDTDLYRLTIVDDVWMPTLSASLPLIS